jgi:hypothetical protein
MYSDSGFDALNQTALMLNPENKKPNSMGVGLFEAVIA